jgi:MFS superfamily sulfate permease-like transporter
MAGTIATPLGSISLTAGLITLLSLAILVGWETRALRRFALVRVVPAPLAVLLLGMVPLKHYLQQIPDGATVIVDATRADFVDHDVRELLDAFVADAPRRQIAVDVRHQVQAQARAARGWSMRRTAAE